MTDYGRDARRRLLAAAVDFGKPPGRRSVHAVMISASKFFAVCAAACLAIVLFCARRGDAHEDGVSVGTLINVRTEGVLFENPAATLLHTGELKGDEFGLEPGLEQRAREFADRSARVRVQYSARYVCWRWNYSSCTFITAIEEDPAGPAVAPGDRSVRP